MIQNKEQQQAVKYDADNSLFKIALYEGEKKWLPVFSGAITLNDKEYLLSFNIPDGSVIRATIIKSRDSLYNDSIFITDMLRYGKNDLSAVMYKSRFELLDLVCTSFPDEYGFKMFGARCIAPYVYVAINTSAIDCIKCQDLRVIGFEVIPSNGLSEYIEIRRTDDDDDSVDGVEKHPPVENEAKRVLEYKPLIKSMIRKLTGKWRDAYLTRHQPSQLPFDAEDLMQFGLMQATIAIRKYRADNEWKAKEATFVYQHLWNRFGQIAHKYSKQSMGYGVTHIRDFIDEDGKLTSSYDLLRGEVDD